MTSTSQDLPGESGLDPEIGLQDEAFSRLKCLNNNDVASTPCIDCTPALATVQFDPHSLPQRNMAGSETPQVNGHFNSSDATCEGENLHGLCNNHDAFNSENVFSNQDFVNGYELPVRRLHCDDQHTPCEETNAVSTLTKSWESSDDMDLYFSMQACEYRDLSEGNNNINQNGTSSSQRIDNHGISDKIQNIHIFESSPSSSQLQLNGHSSMDKIPACKMEELDEIDGGVNHVYCKETPTHSIPIVSALDSLSCQESPPYCKMPTCDSNNSTSTPSSYSDSIAENIGPNISDTVGDFIDTDFERKESGRGFTISDYEFFRRSNENLDDDCDSSDLEEKNLVGAIAPSYGLNEKEKTEVSAVASRILWQSCVVEPSRNMQAPQESLPISDYDNDECIDCEQTDDSTEREGADQLNLLHNTTSISTQNQAHSSQRTNSLPNQNSDPDDLGFIEDIPAPSLLPINNHMYSPSSLQYEQEDEDFLLLPSTQANSSKHLLSLQPSTKASMLSSRPGASVASRIVWDVDELTLGVSAKLPEQLDGFEEFGRMVPLLDPTYFGDDEDNFDYCGSVLGAFGSEDSIDKDLMTSNDLNAGGFRKHVSPVNSPVRQSTDQHPITGQAFSDHESDNQEILPARFRMNVMEESVEDVLLDEGISRDSRLPHPHSFSHLPRSLQESLGATCDNDCSHIADNSEVFSSRTLRLHEDNLSPTANQEAFRLMEPSRVTRSDSLLPLKRRSYSEDHIYEDIDDAPTQDQIVNLNLPIPKMGKGKIHKGSSKVTSKHRSATEKVMLWSEYEAYVLQVKQLGVSACGPTAVVNILQLFDISIDRASLAEAIKVNYRREAAPVPDYLFSRSIAGTTASDLMTAVSIASANTVESRFFPFAPRRDLDLGCWIANWLRLGAVPVLTLNLQAGVPFGNPIPDAWHHQMVYGVDSDGIYLLNPLVKESYDVIMDQLASPSELLIRATDIIKRWNPDTDLTPLLSGPPLDRYPSTQQWRDMNVLGQVVNVVREHAHANKFRLRSFSLSSPNSPLFSPTSRALFEGGTVALGTTTHIRIPAIYKSGVTIFARRDSEAHQVLVDCPDPELAG